MSKLTSNRYSFIINSHKDGFRIRLFHNENERVKEFFIAGHHVDPLRLNAHMESLTDEQCDQWLDPERIEVLKEQAKAEAKLQRERFAADAAKAKQDKADKKEQNRAKQKDKTNEAV